jgi:hypothetical protein
MTAAIAGPPFHRADILYALEWAAVAPGVGRWNVVLDDPEDTRVVSIVPPGAEQPAYDIVRSELYVLLTPRLTPEDGVPVRCFASLREAVLAICPLDDATAVAVNEAMDVLYPRSPRREED